MNRPIIGITMGDPSGNGPELSVKALMKPETYERCRPVIIGDAKCIEAAIQTIEGAEGMKVNVLHSVDEALFELGTIDVYDMAAWASVTALSEESIAMGGHPVPVPDFTRGTWFRKRDVYEGEFVL